MPKPFMSERLEASAAAGEPRDDAASFAGDEEFLAHSNRVLYFSRVRNTRAALARARYFAQKMGDLSPTQKLALAANFVLNSPPGQTPKVIEGEHLYICTCMYCAHIGSLL